MAELPATQNGTRDFQAEAVQSGWLYEGGRNHVLHDRDGTAKVTDFGLARARRRR